MTIITKLSAAALLTCIAAIPAGCEKTPAEKASERRVEDVQDATAQIKKDAEVAKDRTQDAIDKTQDRVKEDVDAAAKAAKDAAEEAAKPAPK